MSLTTDRSTTLGKIAGYWGEGWGGGGGGARVFTFKGAQSLCTVGATSPTAFGREKTNIQQLHYLLTSDK